MKRTLVFFLVLCMLFGLFACAQTNGTEAAAEPVKNRRRAARGGKAVRSMSLRRPRRQPPLRIAISARPRTMSSTERA
jgi:hypothetical protein